jgi:SulP family sulfate permease
MKSKILTTMRGYTSALLLSDALAGLTAAMVAIPLCIAIAIASGTKPAKGLVTAILGGALISPRGGSRVQIGGPRVPSSSWSMASSARTAMTGWCRRC